MFLSMETPAWHQHVGGVMILEPGEQPMRFEDVVHQVEQRLDWVPKFRWTVKNAPLRLDLPMWVDTPGFDVRRHIHRIGVPSPGGPRETGELIGSLMSKKLDRSHPLWELWFIEGLAGGRVAILLKYHHCIADGMSGRSLATVLWDLDPDAHAPTLPLPPEEERTAGGEPTDREVLTHALSEAVRRPFRVARYAGVQAERLVTSSRFLLRGNEPNRVMLHRPGTPFNGVIGPRRSLAFASVALDDVRALKKEHDVKVNDVILATVSGALRSYLIDLDRLPEDPLVSVVPVSVRKEGEETFDNQVATMFVSLSTDVDDPVERLRAINEAATSAKEMYHAVSAREIQSLGEVAAPLVLSAASRALFETHLLTKAPIVPNLVVSSVPGPRSTLYALGAKVVATYPASVLVEGQGVNVTAISYIDRVDFGIHVDPDLVPDPWLIADRIPLAMAELMKASGLGEATSMDPFAH